VPYTSDSGRGGRTSHRKPPEKNLPDAPRQRAEHHRRSYPATSTVAEEAGAATQNSQPERAPTQSSRGRTPRSGSLPRLHGRPREPETAVNRTDAHIHHATTAGLEEEHRGSTSSTPRRRRHGLLSSDGLLRRSPLPPEEQSRDEASLELRSGRSRSKQRHQKRRHKANRKLSNYKNYNYGRRHLPAAAPDRPRRRELRQIGPALTGSFSLLQ
jgi:hypothetical protein